MTEHTQEYLLYLKSPEWRTVRKQALINAAYRCQECGVWLKPSLLHVHHLNYDNLGDEDPEDLLVLCQQHHEAADKERRTAAKREHWHRRLNGWAQQVYGVQWEEYMDYDRVETEFRYWLEEKSY